jgi:hypothetical protein
MALTPYILDIANKKLTNKHQEMILPAGGGKPSLNLN